MNPSKAPLCQAPDANLRRPALGLPAGSTDCHAHICGPALAYPYAQQRIYTPPDALLPNYRALLHSLGVQRAVLVQPSVYAEDNRALIAALATDPLHLRGVAVVSPQLSDKELERLHGAGVRGLRCNIVDLAQAKGSLPVAELTSLAQRIAALGWHLELLMHVNEFPTLAQTLGRLPVPLVFGHLGYVPCHHSVADTGFQNLLALMREGQAWVKLTGPYRISQHSAPPYADVAPFAAALLQANPKRLLWGSDWPHVMVKGTMPHDADLCDLLSDWVSDEGLRQQVLVDNPAALYGF
ncbi:MAG: amidohydrolase family protein [Burkholderiaceae bacterium]